MLHPIRHRYALIIAIVKPREKGLAKVAASQPLMKRPPLDSSIDWHLHYCCIAGLTGTEVGLSNSQIASFPWTLLPTFLDLEALRNSGKTTLKAFCLRGG